MICIPENFPLELTIDPNWIVWKDGKIPFCPRTGKPASSTDPGTWGEFWEAVTVFWSVAYAGIGYVLGKDSPYCVIDIDNAFLEGGEYTEQALIAVNMLDSYTERSVSGKGIHIFIRATKPDERCRRNGIEVYSKDRFIAMTGDRSGDVLTIERRQEELEGLWKHWFPPEPVRPKKRVSNPPVREEEEILLTRMLKNPSFNRLWHGDLSEYRNPATGEVDCSRADMAFCRFLALLTGDDQDWMDELFRRSPLVRKKWDARRGGETYGEKTIRKVVGR